MAVPSAVAMSTATTVRVAPAVVTVAVAQHLDERHQTNRSENEPEHQFLLRHVRRRKEEHAKTPLRVVPRNGEEV
jgi:hypothetical protein